MSKRTPAHVRTQHVGGANWEIRFHLEKLNEEVSSEQKKRRVHARLLLLIVGICIFNARQATASSIFANESSSTGDFYEKSNKDNAGDVASELICIYLKQNDSHMLRSLFALWN